MKEIHSLLIIVLIAVLVAHAQTAEDPNTERHVKKELKDAYKKWLNNDVSWIFSTDERHDFLTLKTGEERDKFIDEYWRKRDEMGLLNERYERTLYADKNFSGASLGSLTDRGRIYILWGGPQSIGYTTIRINGRDDAVLCEKWSYLGQKFTFIDPDAAGNYRLIRDGEEYKYQDSGQ
jgi:GWxTD domain-containing protein